MTEPGPPAGWYPDPDGSGAQRYWDGWCWTEQRSGPATNDRGAQFLSAPPSPWQTSRGKAHSPAQPNPGPSAGFRSATGSYPAQQGSAARTVWIVVAILPLSIVIVVLIIIRANAHRTPMSPSRPRDQASYQLGYEMGTWWANNNAHDIGHIPKGDPWIATGGVSAFCRDPVLAVTQNLGNKPANIADFLAGCSDAVYADNGHDP